MGSLDSSQTRSRDETVPQEPGEAECSAAWLGLTITRLVKVFVRLKMQTAVQMRPREGGMEIYSLSVLQCLTPIDFTEAQTYTTTEDLGPLWFGR